MALIPALPAADKSIVGVHSSAGLLTRLLRRRRSPQPAASLNTADAVVPEPPNPPEPPEPSDEIAGQLAALARQVEELRAENARLREAMLVDPRTGLPNAAAFDADHAQLDHRRRRSQDPYSVIVAQLDAFEAYREARGEDAAGEAVAEVARACARTVRGSDRTYQLGVNELAVLLPGAELREAVAAAERVRRQVEKLALPHPDLEAGVVTTTLAALAAGFRHHSTKEVMVEVQDLLRNAGPGRPNRVVWPI